MNIYDLFLMKISCLMTFGFLHIFLKLQHRVPGRDVRHPHELHGLHLHVDWLHPVGQQSHWRELRPTKSRHQVQTKGESCIYSIDIKIYKVVGT